MLIRRYGWSDLKIRALRRINHICCCICIRPYKFIGPKLFFFFFLLVKKKKRRITLSKLWIINALGATLLSALLSSSKPAPAKQFSIWIFNLRSSNSYEGETSDIDSKPALSIVQAVAGSTYFAGVAKSMYWAVQCWGAIGVPAALYGVIE